MPLESNSWNLTFPAEYAEIVPTTDLNMQLEELTGDVMEIARRAGSFLAAERLKIGESEIELKGKGDLVSRADRESEAMIREALEKLLPGSVVMAEEDSPEATGGDWRWIVDPLDGTMNYLMGLPVWAVSIALEDRRLASTGFGPIAAGVIIAPELEYIYDSWNGGGVRKNGVPVRIRQSGDLSRAFLATGFPFRNMEVLDQYLSVFRKISPEVANIRRIGSAAVDLAWVADGTFDGFWEVGLKPWDIAAGYLMIREAGGLLTDFLGGSPLETGWIVGGNRMAYDFLQPVMESGFPKPTEMYR